MQFTCAPSFRTNYISQPVYISFNEIILQIFNLVYWSGDNRVDKSTTPKIAPFSLVSSPFFPPRRVTREETSKKVITRRSIYRLLNSVVNDFSRGKGKGKRGERDYRDIEINFYVGILVDRSLLSIGYFDISIRFALRGGRGASPQMDSLSLAIIVIHAQFTTRWVHGFTAR